MASFIYGTEINLAIENLISNADRYLWFISPYVKLHERIKHELNRKKENYDLEITVLFGKNDDNVTKSMKAEDIDFFKGFPNIRICYEKNLHAKFYASEDFSLMTSMNLHEYSQNTNIETGILLQPTNAIKKLTNFALNSSDAGDSALQYFEEVIKGSKVLFKRSPIIQTGTFGLTKKFAGSKTEVDELDSFYKGRLTNDGAAPRRVSYHNENKQPIKHETTSGFCIRTGKPIPFNPQRPMSKEAFDSWNKFKNPDYPEKYCHKTGQPSNGKTSMNRPCL